MATVSVIKLKVRRGTDSDRRQITLDVGEIGYVTDAASRRIFVGDGSTRGGNPAGIKFYSGDFRTDPTNLTTAQVGDIVFNPSDTKLYCLTGVNSFNFPDFINERAYQFIGTRVDGQTIQYTTNGALELADNSVTPPKVSDTLFSTEGILRNFDGSIKVNVDDSTIKINGSTGQLYVDPTNINIANFNSFNASINMTSVYFTNLPSSSTGLTPGRVWRDPVGGTLRVV